MEERQGITHLVLAHRGHNWAVASWASDERILALAGVCDLLREPCDLFFHRKRAGSVATHCLTMSLCGIRGPLLVLLALMKGHSHMQQD